MARDKLFFLVAAGWELVRFAALFAILTVRPDGPTPAALSVTALWFGSAQLALVGAFVMVGLFPDRYAVYLPLLRLAKFISIGPAVLLIVTGLPAVVTTAAAVLDLVRLLTPIVIAGVDSILFLFLLSYRIGDDAPPVQRPQEE